MYRDAYGIAKGECLFDHFGSDRERNVWAWGNEADMSRCCFSQGDRVGICSRNYPEYLISFWACREFFEFYVRGFGLRV